MARESVTAGNAIRATPLVSMDETFEKATVEGAELDGVTFYRITVDPGWVWSDHYGSVIGAESCPERHRLFMLSGEMTVEMDDGTRETLREGDVSVIAPGHDAWTEGDERAVFLDIDPGRGGHDEQR
ncbi:cupin domain-containing protein [Natronorarus salvus]|uniref:cupin domain-containing protein n=1 Tax=Natronorarus salvus TaxID=3117733 RepID=UPI002F265F8E